MICNIYVRRSAKDREVKGSTRANAIYNRMNIGEGPRKWAAERADDLGAGTFVFEDINNGNIYVLRIEKIPTPTHRIVD